MQHQVEATGRERDLLIWRQLQLGDLPHPTDPIHNIGAMQGHFVRLQAGQPVQTKLDGDPAVVVQLAVGGGHVATGHRRAHPTLFQHQARRGQALGPGRAAQQQQGGRNQQHFDYHRPDPFE